MTQPVSPSVPAAALWLGGGASLITAVTTFLLWWLPQSYQVAPGFEGLVALHQESAYMARLWVNYVHVLLALGAYLTVAAVLFKRAPVAACVGFLSFLIWAIVELIGVAINIWAVNETWRAAYATAEPAQQQIIQTSLHTAAGLWDSVFFVVLTGFLVGTLCYGIGLVSGGRLQRVLGCLFLLAVPLTLIIMLDGYFQASLSQWISWSYPILQPVSRALMGVWLLTLALAARPVRDDLQQG